LKSDLVLLHDIKLNNIHTLKLTWRWLKSFRVVKMNTEKEWYRIAEFNEAILKETIAENRLKKRANQALKSEISNKQKNEDQNLLMTTLIEKIVSEIRMRRWILFTINWKSLWTWKKRLSLRLLLSWDKIVHIQECSFDSTVLYNVTRISSSSVESSRSEVDARRSWVVKNVIKSLQVAWAYEKKEWKWRCRRLQCQYWITLVLRIESFKML